MDNERIKYQVSSYRERYMMTLIANQLKDVSILQYRDYTAYTDVILLSAGTQYLVEFKFKNETHLHPEVQSRGIMIKEKKYKTVMIDSTNHNLPVLY